MAWVRVSMPVAAMSSCDLVWSSVGSMMEISGMMTRLRMHIFIFFRLSSNTANWLTSAPVPAVVGAQISGRIGWETRLQPTKSLMLP